MHKAPKISCFHSKPYIRNEKKKWLPLPLDKCAAQKWWHKANNSGISEKDFIEVTQAPFSFVICVFDFEFLQRNYLQQYDRQHFNYEPLT